MSLICAKRSDGKRAAASTARRHRVISVNALDYAHELGAIDTGKNLVREVSAQAGKWEDVPGSGSDGWGELEFGDAEPGVGRDWTDDGDQRDRPSSSTA